MTTTRFNESELSSYAGRPVTLYKFKRGSKLYLYAESDRDVTIGFDTYQGCAISDDGVALTGNAVQDTFKVHLPSSLDLAVAYQGTAPSQPVTLTVLRYHPGDADAIVSYVGQVQQVSQKSPGMSDIDCVSLSSTFKRDGLRIAWERSCPYALYDNNCKANMALYGTFVVIVSIFDGTLIVPDAAAKPDNYYSGGFIEWGLEENAITERRGIQYHQGQGLQVFGLTDGLVEGQGAMLYPGCGRNTSDCANKFNNLVNYGGFPMMPGKSPFDGDPVF